jgi:hypothetical protein
VVGEQLPDPVDPDIPLATPESQWVKSDTTVSGASANTFTVDLDTNMIPIVNAADVGASWCNYDIQKWCNAVTVSPSTLADYQSSPDGTPVIESDILGYWVYVPRYQYQVQRFSPADPPSCGPAATNNPGGVTGTCSTTLSDGLYGPRNFNIKFQKSTDPIATPTQTGDWSTHPAFTAWTAANGGAGLNGLWVGKFETTGSPGALTIKPNQTSLRGQQVGLQFDEAKRIGTVDLTAESYGTAAYLNSAGTAAIPQNQHNLSTAKTHDFTNPDWGAAIYLATSAYGAGDQTFANGASNPNDFGIVAKNANSDYVTGCGPAADHNNKGSYSGGLTCNNAGTDSSYYTSRGLQASTTQNVYGIYDMAGGADEYVMALYYEISRSYGFSVPDEPYGNRYLDSDGFTSAGTNTNFNRCTYATCGGQGLYEITFVTSVSGQYQLWSCGPSLFVWSNGPWWLRGSSYFDHGGLNVAGSGLFFSWVSANLSSSAASFRVGAAVW